MSVARGVSLAEVLIILALSLVAAAAVVPRVLNSRIAANEATAIANVNVITSAQEAYRSAYPAIGYANSLAHLAMVCKQRPCVPTPEHACLIDCNLPAATYQSKDGYFYNLAAGPEGTTPQQSYVVAATASLIHKTGDQDYCAVEDARIRSQQPLSNTAATAIDWAGCRKLPVLP